MIGPSESMASSSWMLNNVKLIWLQEPSMTVNQLKVSTFYTSFSLIADNFDIFRREFLGLRVVIKLKRNIIFHVVFCKECINTFVTMSWLRHDREIS